MQADLTRGNWHVLEPLKFMFDCEEQSRPYTAEDAGHILPLFLSERWQNRGCVLAGAYSNADVNSRGMLHLFCALLDPDANHDALRSTVAAMPEVGTDTVSS